MSKCYLLSNWSDRKTVLLFDQMKSKVPEKVYEIKILAWILQNKLHHFGFDKPISTFCPYPWNELSVFCLYNIKAINRRKFSRKSIEIKAKFGLTKTSHHTILYMKNFLTYNSIQCHKHRKLYEISMKIEW